MKPVIKNFEKRLAAYEKRLAKSGRTMPLKYKKRRGIFENYKASCTFDPVTGFGTSYRWYALTKVIRGVLVLNTYTYSNQTAKHVSKVRAILRELNTPFVCLDAPRGLDHLDVARNYIARLYGRGVVEAKYARNGHTWTLNNARAQITTARKLGLTFPAALLKTAVTEAEQERRERLDRLKARRFQLMQARSNGDVNPSTVLPLESQE